MTSHRKQNKKASETNENSSSISNTCYHCVVYGLLYSFSSPVFVPLETQLLWFASIQRNQQAKIILVTEQTELKIIENFDYLIIDLKINIYYRINICKC